MSSLANPPEKVLMDFVRGHWADDMRAEWSCRSINRRDILKLLPLSMAGSALASSVQVKPPRVAQGARAIRLSTYFKADEFERYLKGEDAIDQAIGVCEGYRIQRVYLETFRGGFQPLREVIAHARDRFRGAGFDVAGAISTTKYGIPGNVLTFFPCLTHEQSQKDLEKMFRFAAGLFDTILIDEYIWSHCTCDRCQAAKGDRTWTDFRCAQLRQVCHDFVITPARAVNPNIRLIYKFPAMYEELAHQGQDIDFMLQEFDGIWAGTEVGPFVEFPQNMLRSQGPYRAFFYMHWMLAMGGEKTGGGWIMPLQDSGYLRDSAYQSVLAGPPELVLHPYGGISSKFDWDLGGEGEFPALLRDTSALVKLASIVKENPLRGLATARPSRVKPWDFGKAYDANVFDFIGQLGIPLLSMRNLPERAEGYFLSLHVRGLADYQSKIQKLTESRAPILVTDGLASFLDRQLLDSPNVQVIETSVSEPTLYDYRGFPDPYDLAQRLRPIPRAEAWAALADEIGWDVSMRYMADPHMAAKVFSLALGGAEQFRRRWPAATYLEALRERFLKPFGLSLRGSLRVSLQPLGREFVVLHNFNDYPVSMWLKSEGESNIEAVVSLPSIARIKVLRSEGGARVELDGHALTCLHLGR
jgi:hypothetical protein